MELSNEWIFKKEFLEDVNSPRFNHVTDIRKEKEYRFKTIWFMKDLSNSLRPSPSKDGQKDRKEEEAEYDIRKLKVLWTASTFLQRFYVFHSFDSHNRFAVAVACLFLASKVEECPMRLSDHIYMFFKLRRNETWKKSDQAFKDMEREVLLAERILLQTLSFDLNVVHPYQYFRQIIGKDLRPWFADPDDSRETLRLATTLLSDSFRVTLCLQYPANQVACALVFLALCISGKKPTPSSASSSGSSGGYGRGLGLSHSSTGIAAAGHTDTTWLDLFEKDVDEIVLQNICMTMVEMYESAFAPQDLPFPVSATAQLKSDLAVQVQAASQRRALHLAGGLDNTTDNGKHNDNGLQEKKSYDGSVTPERGSEESKAGSSPLAREIEIEGAASSKRKQFSPSHAPSSSGSSGGGGGGGNGSSNYLSMPPPMPPLAIMASSVAASSSPCYDASTPRSAFRSVRALPPALPPAQAHAQAQSVEDHALLLVSSVQSPDLPPPPPDDNAMMDSDYSTFSQLHAAQYGGGVNNNNNNNNFEEGNQGEDTPAGSVADTPTYMPPPPETPGSMASTPNFEHLPGLQHLSDSSVNVFQNNYKKPRTDY